MPGCTCAYVMCCMQIQPCPIKSTHPWERCCYAHPHENARRRDPRQYRYIAEPCPDYKRGICLLVRHLVLFGERKQQMLIMLTSH